jgi:hypothetical protein
MQTADDYSAQNCACSWARKSYQGLLQLDITFTPSRSTIVDHSYFRLRSFVVRATGVGDEDRRSTVTHELNLVGH